MKKIELLHQKKNSFSKIKWKHQHRNDSFETDLNISQHEIDTFYLLSIDSPFFLKSFLGIDFNDLVRHINYPEYFEYEIRKKKGGVRKISAPTEKLKLAQKRLNYFLQQYYYLFKPDEVFGFIRHPKYQKTPSPIVENANAHVLKKEVLNIDIKDFFSSISANRVKKLFSSEVFRFDENIATALALLCTYEGKLPTGAPTSPVISNFICIQMDEELLQFCNKNNLTYSRYADDLTFSSMESISTDQLLDIISIIQANKFNINEKKLRIKSAGQQQRVTGLIVNEKINVPREYIKKTRAMIYDLTHNGILAATKNHFKIKGEISFQHCEKFFNRLSGMIQFIGQVRGPQDKIFLTFRSQFNQYQETIITN